MAVYLTENRNVGDRPIVQYVTTFGGAYFIAYAPGTKNPSYATAPTAFRPLTSELQSQESYGYACIHAKCQGQVHSVQKLRVETDG